MEKFTHYSHSFKVALQQHFAARADDILHEMEPAFESMQDDVAFSTRSKNPMDRRLSVAAMFLALIQVMETRGHDFNKIREVCLDVAQEYVRPKNFLHRKLKSLQGRMVGMWLFQVIVRGLGRRIRILAHPDGFVAHIITDKKETLGLGYGIDIIECGICKLYRKYQHEKYARILCDVDYITSSMSGLDLVRTSTIAYGAKTCDFRFKRKES